MRNLVKRLIAWVKALIKKQLKRFRAWLNSSKVVLSITMLIIGISWTFVYEHRADIETVKKIRIEVNIAEAYQDTSVKAGVHQAIEKSEPKNSIESETPMPSSSQISLLIEKAFPEDPETMLAIAKAESRLNPNATNINKNGSKDCGLFQINSVHGYDCEWLKDPKNNIKAAREVYEKQGLVAWVAYTSERYIDFK
jgi:hypothetical protein